VKGNSIFPFELSHFTDWYSDSIGLELSVKI
jgi:hypothetical protein